MIDFHTHPTIVHEIVEKYPEQKRAARDIFNIGNNFQPLETFILQMDVAGIAQAVLLPIECSRARGVSVSSNEQVAELCAMGKGRFIGFASVDPLRDGAAHELEHAVRSMGLRGLKLDPAMQDFCLSDEGLLPVLEVADAFGIPVLFHTGMSWAPDTPLEKGHPLLLEPAIRRYSKLNFVLAHFAWPWVWEAVALALKYSNVYLDTSCLYYDSPREFFQFLFTQQVPVTVIERSLRNKIVFGSNYPRVEIKNMVHALKSLPLTEGCVHKITRGNADRLLATAVLATSATAD